MMKPTPANDNISADDSGRDKLPNKDREESTPNEDGQSATTSMPLGWGNLPSCVLSKVFSFLNFWDRARASTVCCHWNSVFHHPELWRSFDFEVTQETTSYLKSTPKGLIKQVLQQHQEHLRFVSFSIDGHPKSAELACDILSQMVNCSLKTLELISSAKPMFMIHKDKFVSALNVMVVNSPQTISSLALSETPVDDPSLLVLANTHQDSLKLLDMESCPNASPRGMTVIADQCQQLHQLTIDYSHLSDELLSALSRDEHVKLKFLKLNITKETPQEQFHAINHESWDLMATHSPNMKLVMNFYVLDNSDYTVFFNYETPVTHVYFGQSVSQEVLRRLGGNCHRLVELVICANGNRPLDKELLQIAVQCKQLESLGLGECEVHCSAIVKIAKICGRRLTQLFIREEVLNEDEQFNIDQMTEEVSTYLGRDWNPESMPYWD